MGEYNFEPGELVNNKYGNDVDVAGKMPTSETLHHDWVPTCKHKNEGDQIWLAAQLLKGVDTQEIFADHVTLHVKLHIPATSFQTLHLPRPVKIPQDQLQLDS